MIILLTGIIISNCFYMFRISHEKLAHCRRKRRDKYLWFKIYRNLDLIFFNEIFKIYQEPTNKQLHFKELSIFNGIPAEAKHILPQIYKLCK